MKEDKNGTHRLIADEDRLLERLIKIQELPALEEGSSHPSEDLLAGYAAGMLLQAERDALEDHLAACPACLETIARAGEESDAIAAAGRAGVSKEIPRRASRVAAVLVTLAAACLVLILHPVFKESFLLDRIFQRLSAASSPRAVERAYAGIPNSDPFSNRFLHDFAGISGRYQSAVSAKRSESMGARNIIPLAPLKTCRETRPEFTFKRSGESGPVQVELFFRDRQLWTFQATSNRLTYPEQAEALKRGATYHYYLRDASHLRDPSEDTAQTAVSGPFFFTVISAEALAKLEADLAYIEKARIKEPAQSFFTGILLGNAGVYGEARPFLESLTADSRGGAAVLMLLACIQRASGDEAGFNQTMTTLRNMEPGD